MRLSRKEETEREALFSQGRAARTREEVQAAREALRVWKARHPDDPGLPSAFGDLKMMEFALDARDAEARAKAEQAA